MAPYPCSWTEMMDVLDGDVVVGFRIRFIVGQAVMGSIFWSTDGIFYPATQMHRFGPFRRLDMAKVIIEDNALLEVLTFPTYGNA